MPCDTVQTSKIEVGVMVPDVLAAGLRADGWQVQTDGPVVKRNLHTGARRTVAGDGALRAWGTGAMAGVFCKFEDGAMTFSTRAAVNLEAAAAAVKRCYAAELVRQQAARFGWRVSAGVGGKLVLQR